MERERLAKSLGSLIEVLGGLAPQPEPTEEELAKAEKKARHVSYMRMSRSYERNLPALCNAAY